MKTKGFKRITTFIVAIMMLVVGVSPLGIPKAYAATSALSALPVGTKIMFAGQQFAVVTPSTGLVVSLKNIGVDSFDDDSNQQLYDPADINNVAYYLRNTYYPSFPATERALIKNSAWYRGNELNVSSSTPAAPITTYIGLLNNSEYNAIKGSIFQSAGDYSKFWLITPYSGYTNMIYYVESDGTVDWVNTYDVFGVRPALRITETTVFTKDPYSGMYYYGSTGATSTVNSLATGSTIMFHGEAWKLVNPSTGKLVSDRIIEKRIYDPDDTQIFDPTGSTYGTNNIGYYLNNTYYNTYTATEKALIKNTTWDARTPTLAYRYPDPTSKIGFLSQAEYNALRGTVYPTGGEYNYWWMMTPSTGLYDIQAVGYLGELYARNIIDPYGVRPALCILETTNVVSLGNGTYALDPDVIAPTATVGYSTTSPTNVDVVATITPSESVSVTNNGGSTSYTFTANGSFVFNFIDTAGNTGTATATVSNIDKIGPTTPTLTPNTSSPTNTNVTVTISDWGDAAITEYKIDTEVWTAYTVPIVMTTNGTIYARGTDVAGNESATNSLSIVNIDKTGPDAPVADIITGTYGSAQTITVTTEVDAIIYYTTDGISPNNANISYTLPIVIDGNDGETKTLKLVSYDTAGNKGTEAMYQYTFAKSGPTITLDTTSRVKSTADISVVVAITPASGTIASWEYQWDTDQTLDEGNWIAGAMPLPQTVTQTTDGTWYLHIRATDSSANVTTIYYGIYKKGIVLTNDEFDAGDIGDRKWFKYYIGKDKNEVMKVMLVAGNINDDIMLTFNKGDILDENGKYKDRVFYIDRKGKIKIYSVN